VRGKIKLGTSALVLSLIVSYMLAFVPSAFAIAEIRATKLEAPLLGPGSLFTVDVTADNFVGLWSYSFVLNYDPSIVRVVSLTAVKGTPAFFTHTSTSSFDNNAGTVTLAADREALAGFTDISGFQILIALINFQVVGRGLSALHYASATFADPVGGSIAVSPIDGFFDNRLQGSMSAPHILDTNLIPESFFDVFVEVADILPAHPWGAYQFTMSFDPNMVVAVDADALNGFSPVYLDIGTDHVTIAASGGNLVAPSAVARIGFVSIASGTTQLLLSNVKAVDLFGNVLTIAANDGSFANVADISVSLNTIFVESRKWSVSRDGNTFTLTSQFTNTGAGLTMARAHFVVYDRLGAVVADLTTGAADIMLGGTMRLSASLGLATLSTDAVYKVEGTVQYVDNMGAWATGHKGLPTSSRLSMIKSFELFP
jgi:hypothetical protein